MVTWLAVLLALESVGKHKSIYIVAGPLTLFSFIYTCCLYLRYTHVLLRVMCFKKKPHHHQCYFNTFGVCDLYNQPTCEVKLEVCVCVCVCV
jgi:hypothetical protein